MRWEKLRFLSATLRIVANESARPPINVLIVDDEASQRNPLAAMISAWGFVVETAGDGQEALDRLATFQANVIITDLMMPRMDGFELMKRLGADGNMPPAIVLTAFGNIETAIQTMHDLGAFWFLEKPIQPNAMRVLLERASAQSVLAEDNERLQRQLAYQGVLVDMVGTSPQMQQVFSLIRQVAPSKASVLVAGESGTGKELVARAIHHLSSRRTGPFVAINCAALPETLMESELFGHEKGAFTGALERRAGCFELAQHGTLLLDELAEMPVGTQAKLLRVLEDSRVRRLPGNVRELRNVLERAVIVAGEGVIMMAHLPYDFGVSSGTRPAAQVFEPEGVRLPVGTTVAQGEKALIQLTLQHTRNNKTRAADILGISLKTLFNKLKEYGAENAAEA
jgi:DNA-binding NtrC family response regulator